MVVGARSIAVTPHVSLYRDTCNVYVLRSGSDAVLIDFGDGRVLDHLDELEVERVTDVLLTHHHRDQLGGLRRAADAGIRIWAPPVERDLIARVDEHWQARRTQNDYDLREDRFSLLASVPLDGLADEYRTRRYGGLDIYTLPTPGHTIGSLTYVVELGGRRLAFTGDLLHGAGKVWSLAATQWTYGGVEGMAATILSLAALLALEPDVLLPSHGEPMDDPPAAAAATGERLRELWRLRSEAPWDLDRWLEDPWERLTPHLLRNRTSFASSYALLSDDGAALLLDWGYDQCVGLPGVTERAARRPLLASLPALRRHGVQRIEVVVPTHYHDDHVAGINLLRDVEGTEVWAPENVAPVIERPERYDLPCLWFDPIPVDRTLPLGRSVRWHEHELTVHPLPGHTLYAAAIQFEVDGRRVLATGDQQTDGARPILNYQYRNRARPEDFVASAELYRRLRPDLVVSGHWQPQDVDEAWVEQLRADAVRFVELHRELLPADGFGAQGFGARIEPYRPTLAPGATAAFEVTVRNPFESAETATVRLVVPAGWTASPPEQEIQVEPNGEAVVGFRVTVGATGGRLAADLTVAGARFGQQAEALVEIG